MLRTIALTVALQMAVGAMSVQAQERPSRDAMADEQGGVVLRYRDHEASYTVEAVAEQLDEVGGVLDEDRREMAVSLRLVSAVFSYRAGDGDAARTVEIEGAGDGTGAHIPHSWLAEDWLRPFLPAVKLPESGVEVGTRWRERFRLLLTVSELEGAGRVEYEVEEIDGDRVTISFRGRGNGVRRVEGGEAATGRPVFLNADTSREGRLVFHAAEGRIVEMEQTLEMRVVAEPLDSRRGSESQFLQHARVSVTAR